MAGSSQILWLSQDIFLEHTHTKISVRCYAEMFTSLPVSCPTVAPLHRTIHFYMISVILWDVLLKF